MAKGKVFADGELLTASDINDYLNPSVPSDGDVVDTGWVDIKSSLMSAFASGSTLYARRIGMTVEIRGFVNGSFPDAGATNFIAVGSIPGQFRPTSLSELPTGRGYGAGGYDISWLVRADGSAAYWARTGISTPRNSCRFAIAYFA